MREKNRFLALRDLVEKLEGQAKGGGGAKSKAEKAADKKKKQKARRKRKSSKKLTAGRERARALALALFFGGGRGGEEGGGWGGERFICPVSQASDTSRGVHCGMISRVSVIFHFWWGPSDHLSPFSSVRLL